MKTVKLGIDFLHLLQMADFIFVLVFTVIIKMMLDV